MRKSLAALLLGAALCAPIANAQLAFSSFGPGDTYTTGSGATISGPSSIPGNWTQASQFTALNGGILDQVRVATFYAAGQGDMHVTLLNDSGNNLGSLFIDWGYNDSTSGGHITTLTNPFNNITLNSGDTYWIQMSATDSMWHGWNFAVGSVPTGRVAWSQTGTSWSYADNATLMAFDVTVRPIPEPASMTALALGVTALLARRRKKA